MSSNRPNLTVDQQFFQELLSAAYTIQEHNDRLNEASASPAVTKAPEPEAKSICPQCGALKANDQSTCQKCGPGELRPGERMQRKWASMWLLSQQQGLWPERPVDAEEAASNHAAPLEIKRGPRTTAAHDFAGSGIISLPFDGSLDGSLEDDGVASDKTQGLHRGNGDRMNGDRPKGDGLNGDRANGNRAIGTPANGGHGSERGNGSSVFAQPVPDKFEFETEFPVSNWTFETNDSQPAADLPDVNLPAEHLSSADFQLNSVAQEDVTAEDFDLAAPAFHPSTDDALALDDAISVEGDFDDESESAFAEPDAPHLSLVQRIADWRVKLRFHRADVYLGAAVLVAAAALLWPVAGSSQHPTLGLWDRTLIAVGIAEAPAPSVHVQGDPAIEVWVDPHSALYYCPGEEQYGKTQDGRFNSQREAQMDRFEPAGRLACE
jgi:ribosomal protein L40E